MVWDCLDSCVEFCAEVCVNAVLVISSETSNETLDTMDVLDWFSYDETLKDKKKIHFRVVVAECELWLQQRITA